MENKAFFSRLTFFNVSEQDYGNYTCVASNQLGNTNASMILYGEWGWGNQSGRGNGFTDGRDMGRVSHVFWGRCVFAAGAFCPWHMGWRLW